LTHRCTLDFKLIDFLRLIPKGWWREHRTVCQPDFQGVGLENALSEFVASKFVENPTCGRRVRASVDVTDAV
jgi:hypothetical protein